MLDLYSQHAGKSPNVTFIIIDSNYCVPGSFDIAIEGG